MQETRTWNRSGGKELQEYVDTLINGGCKIQQIIITQYELYKVGDWHDATSAVIIVDKNI